MRTAIREAAGDAAQKEGAEGARVAVTRKEPDRLAPVPEAKQHVIGEILALRGRVLEVSGDFLLTSTRRPSGSVILMPSWPSSSLCWISVRALGSGG